MLYLSLQAQTHLRHICLPMLHSKQLRCVLCERVQNLLHNPYYSNRRALGDNQAHQIKHQNAQP